MDREFKVIKLGIEAFDGIYEKLQQSSNQSQKNKLEDDLKTTIKKLQRSRDKVKGWASSNDIKDKNPLLEQRKLIESVRSCIWRFLMGLADLVHSEWRCSRLLRKR